MMIEEDDYDELPMISMDSLNHDTMQGIIEMPSADQLAAERAREEECEQELIRLQQSEAELEVALPFQDSNSSSSEAETLALAGAVNDLQVQTTQHAANATYTSLSNLLSTIANELPDDAQPLLRHPDVKLALHELVGQVSALVSCDEALWSNDEILAIGALLAGASLSHDSTVRMPALRSLHTLLNYRASIEQGIELVRVLLRAISDTHLRLELSDALRCSASVQTDKLAALTLDVTLLELLDPRPHDIECVSLERIADAVSAGWSRLSAADAYLVLQLIGRRLAESRARETSDSDLSARKRLLQSLQLCAQSHETQRPDLIKVMVAATRLGLLFKVDSTPSNTASLPGTN